MLKNIFAVLAASVVAVAPALATPTRTADEDFTTGDLMQVMRDNGIMITINSDCEPDVLGAYLWSGMKRTMRLCPGQTVDAIDHATVRHETWHAIQHCVNMARGTSTDTPVQEDLDVLAEYVNESLTVETVNYVKANYPVSQWPTEFEANLAENLFTAYELKDIFLKACTDR